MDLVLNGRFSIGFLFALPLWRGRGAGGLSFDGERGGGVLVELFDELGAADSA